MEPTGSDGDPREETGAARRGSLPGAGACPGEAALSASLGSGCAIWLEPLAGSRGMPAVVALPDGQALVIGDGPDAELFAPDTGTWQTR